MAKSFVKVFLICLVLFTLILIPVIKLISNIQIFDNSGISGGIEDEIDVLVDPNSPFFEAFADAKRVNLLALGINDGLSDVLMLVSWDMDENKVDLISVPRDTYYEREGYTSPGQKKINAAYASKEGLISTANAVSDVLMGIPINYYAIQALNTGEGSTAAERAAKAWEKYVNQNNGQKGQVTAPQSEPEQTEAPGI